MRNNPLLGSKPPLDQHSFKSSSLTHKSANKRYESECEMQGFTHQTRRSAHGNDGDGHVSGQGSKTGKGGGSLQSRQRVREGKTLAGCGRTLSALFARQSERRRDD